MYQQSMLIREFFMPYASSNMLCGKLVCSWPHRTLISRANLSVIYTHIREELCVSTYLHTDRILHTSKSTYKGPEERDETFVEDGSTCGPEMVIKSTELQVL